MTSANPQIFVGNIIHCIDRTNMQVIENGFIIVIGSKILAIGDFSQLQEAKARLILLDSTPARHLTKSQILIPGFVNVHIHAPQYPRCGISIDKQVSDWLKDIAYPLELKYTDTDFSRRVFKAVVQKTLTFGTTTVCYHGNIYNESNFILVDTILEEGQRAFIGKINMTHCFVDEYQESFEESISSTLEFIKYVQSKKSDLIKPIITPSYALSCDMELMTKLGEIAENENLHIQTHISEDIKEMEQVQTKYGMEYAFIYDKAKLLTEKTILTHAIFLSIEEMKLLASRKVSIAHCPDATTLLRGGVCNVKQLWNYNINVGLGTGIVSPSLLRTMKVCSDSSLHIGFHLKNYVPLTYKELFYLATLGGSEALSLSDITGNFEIGKDFDALIVDMDIEEDYLIELTPKQILQKLIYTGDDRNIINVFVAGKQVK